MLFFLLLLTYSGRILVSALLKGGDNGKSLGRRNFFSGLLSSLVPKVFNLFSGVVGGFLGGDQEQGSDQGGLFDSIGL